MMPTVCCRPSVNKCTRHLLAIDRPVLRTPLGVSEGIDRVALAARETLDNPVTRYGYIVVLVSLHTRYCA